MNTNLRWRKSTYSGDQNACVELAATADSTYIRDSKNPEAGTLGFSTSTFRVFVATLEN